MTSFRTIGSLRNRLLNTAHARRLWLRPSPLASGQKGAKSGRTIPRGGDVAALAVGIALLAAFPTAATTVPCGKHTGAKRAACLQHRAAQAWPTHPTVSEIRSRVGAYNWSKARRVAMCETGMRLDWYPSGTYRGPFGMYVTTQAYGMRATGYWSPTTWQEHVAIAVAAHPITGGWQGWGCRNA